MLSNDPDVYGASAPTAAAVSNAVEAYVDSVNALVEARVRRARELGAPALLVDTPDYAHLAVTAAYGNPSRSAPFDDRDPRKPRSADTFASPAALAERLRAAPTAWLVVTRAHAPVARAVGDGLIKDHLPFARTAKGGRGKKPGEFQAFWETVLGGLLVLGAALWLCFSRNIVGCMAAGMLAFSLARILL